MVDLLLLHDRLRIPLLICDCGLGLRHVHHFGLVVLLILLLPQVRILAAYLAVVPVVLRDLLRDAAPRQTHEPAAEIIARAVHRSQVFRCCPSGDTARAVLCSTRIPSRPVFKPWYDNVRNVMGAGCPSLDFWWVYRYTHKYSYKT